MTEAFTIASIWLALAVLATILANRLRISTALVEICIGVLAATYLSKLIGHDVFDPNREWLRFIASTGSILLTFLAGAELDPAVMKIKWKEVLVVGLVGFLSPFLGCAAVARFLLHWSPQSSLLAGVALSTTSMAVVYAVMLEYGFNKTEFGKGILGACFINDLGTVIVLGLLFAPFTYRSLVFIGVSVIVFALLPFITAGLTKMYGNRTAAIRTKWILFVLFSMGALALWSGSEAVLPAYIAGMVLAGTISRDEHFIRRLRTLTIGFLTPFFFIRAGTLVSLPAVFSAPIIFVVLFSGKALTKIFGLYPIIKLFRSDEKEQWYYTLLMSTGLTFGAISALFGLTHKIVSQSQYSFLVAAVIASAVIPTIIANIFFLPKHLLGKIPLADDETPQLDLIQNGSTDKSQNGMESE